MHHISSLKYIFSTIKSSFAPAFFLLAALVYFYAQNPLPFEVSLIFHCCFWAISALTLALLFLANKSKPFLIMITGILCYVLLNQFKQQFGAEFINSGEYRSLCFIVPLNILIIGLMPTIKIKTTQMKYILIAFLAEIVACQWLCSFINIIPHVDIKMESAPLWSYAVWTIALCGILTKTSVKNTVINTGLFYAVCSLFMGVIYAENISALTIFFLSFCLIMSYTILTDLYKRYHYDYLENVGSSTAYLSHASSKFPFKYTIVLFSIDNNDKLKKALGTDKFTTLEQLIVNKILELPYETSIYRYNENELILVFKNEDAKHTKEFADNIRHTIAASEFVFADKRNLKITISVCVSEKTRKDLNASEVTDRAHRALNKSHHFNCNVTTVA